MNKAPFYTLYSTLFSIYCCFLPGTLLAQKTIFSPLGQKEKLLWSDEFNYQGLPDSAKWGYETGFVRNKEAQIYTHARLENSRVSNGCLVITARKEKFGPANYTSASINTLRKEHFVGDIRVEVRAKLPQGQGIWPAIWMMGVNRSQTGWPKCSEIDIMEFVGHTPGTVWGTLHWWDSTATPPLHVATRGSKMYIDNLHSDYHVYGLERKGNVLQLFVDDQYYFRLPVPLTAWPQSFTGPLYLLLDLAVGGTWGGEVDNSIFPQEFYIDYVRVYRIK
jgi:beta-glucanase (GH16 family)